MARKYSIYKLTSPSGKSYVGLTVSSIKERWRQHVKRARTGFNHPLCCAIRKYGPDVFIVECLISNIDTLETAKGLEISEIAKLPTDRYNLSPGGEYDGHYAAKLFWDNIKRDPEARRVYAEKLSEIKKANDWSDYEDLSSRAAKWRKDNAKIAYKLSYRALRIIRRNRVKTEAEPDSRSRLEKLRWKYNRSKSVQIAATKQWANCSSEEKQAISSKISVSHKKKNALKSKEQKHEMVAKARASIDRSVQGPAASRGIKKFWQELKADPLRYKEYMDKRTASLLKTVRK